MIRKQGELLVEAFTVWNAINAGRLASSIAFFGMLSLAPMLALIVGIAARLLSLQQQDILVGLLDSFLGAQAAVVAEAIFSEHNGISTGGVIITVVSIVTFLWSTTTLFSLVKLALDEIWAIPSGRSGLVSMARRKVTALIVVLVLGLMLTVLLGISTILNRTSISGGEFVTRASAGVGDLSGGLVFLTLIAAVTYKFIPDFRLPWRDIWGGAFLTALATMIAKVPLQIYLNRYSTASIAGITGTVILILFAMYAIALIYFFGASYIRVYAHRYGSLKGQAYELSRQL